MSLIAGSQETTSRDLVECWLAYDFESGHREENGSKRNPNHAFDVMPNVWFDFHVKDPTKDREKQRLNFYGGS